MADEGRKAYYNDQIARKQDEESKTRKYREQERFKLELDQQIRGRNELAPRQNARSCVDIHRRELTYGQARPGDILGYDPAPTQMRSGRGRGMFSPISQVANSLFGN